MDNRVFFGSQEVSAQEKSQKVMNVFSSVASSYDLMNDLMSLGAHRLWKRLFLREVAPRPGMNILDVAGGSGDIALGLLKKSQFFKPPVQVTVCDLNAEMLAVARHRAIEARHHGHLSFVQGDALALPLPSETYDVYTIAFGLRNVADFSKALQEAHRVLKPGGRFLCLEFSKIKLPWVHRLYDAYAFQVIPRLGQWIAQDRDAYTYLVESIERFPSQEHLGDLLKESGFHYVRHRNFFNGIVALHQGVKD